MNFHKIAETLIRVYIANQGLGKNTLEIPEEIYPENIEVARMLEEKVEAQ